MINWSERDPEEIGPEHPEDRIARERFAEMRHEFILGVDGKCDEVLGYGNGVERRCGADSWSVLHIDEMLDMHDHGGFDCMCFEGDF